MSGKKVKLWYDREGDILEIFWDNSEGYFTATENDQVMANVDMKGNVQGFLIEGVSKISGTPLEVNLLSGETETPPAASNKPPERRFRQRNERSKSQDS
ncbi:MAG: DUF2283 domain-containing protein [Dehalococcoidia bacterium]